jgi:hypothetical protein
MENNMRTGIHGGQGPRQPRLVKGDNEPLNLDMPLEEAVKKSIQAATWLEEADLGAAQQAVMLAKTMDEMPDRRHQIAPMLTSLLSNLGLLNNRQEDKTMTPQEMLTAIAGGK